MVLDVNAVQSVGRSLVHNDDRTIWNGKRDCVGVINVIERPSALIVPMDCELYVGCNPQAWEAIEESTDELSGTDWITFETPAQAPYGYSVLSKDLGEQVEIFVENLTCLDPYSKLCRVLWRSFDEGIHKLTLPLEPAATRLHGRLRSVPVLFTQKPEFLIVTWPCHE